MEAADFTEVRLTVDAGVALVELARPDRRNAWSGRMAVEYRWALHHAEVDPAARVVVVTGAGPDFCVGADTRALDDIGRRGGSYEREALPLPPFPEGTPEELRRNHSYPWSLSVPVLAAINGGCAGAGFVVATYADLRVAASDARIATAFAGLGLPAEYGTGWVLPRLTGVPRALELMYEPGPISAERARDLGWVQQVVAPDRLRDEVLDRARRMARDCSATALRWIKRSMLVDADGPFGAAYTRSVEEMDEALRGTDMKAALASRRAGRRHDFRSDPEDPGEG